MSKAQYVNKSVLERYRYHRDCQLKKKYGISLNDYELMFKDQQGKCDICGRPETRKASTGKYIVLSVDHNHSTGKVRGLLCYKCNVMLGSATESIEVLTKAIDYLMKHNA